MIVDKYLEQFVIGSDMLRIEIDDEELRFYVLAYLQTAIAQALLRQGKTGSVIDHLSPDHVGELEIPLLDQGLRSSIAAGMSQSTNLRESARLALGAALEEYEKSLPRPNRQAPLKSGWTVGLKDVSGRLDAAFYDPLVGLTRNALRAAGGRPVKDVAEVLKPQGRYKTRYVEREYGKPILSGAQVLQFKPINLRFMPEKAFQDVSRYQLATGWIAFQADGRFEEALGFPVMVTSDRDGWLASGHVGRLIPREGVEPGWLYLAARTWCAQIQVKALACGSVVDALYPTDLEEVILPPKLTVDSSGISNAWEMFAAAQREQDAAVQLIESKLIDIMKGFYPCQELREDE
ncbi:MAG: hypothetical protein WAR21_13345 [Candidatus Acidiferrales bacterium]